ncbi:Uncharacterised protein r2_g2711 [Pycnogonum litorale]
MAFKTGPLELGGKEKSHTEQDREVVLLGQQMPDVRGVVRRCIVVVKQPLFFPATTLAHRAKQMPQDLFVDLPIDRLALWQELTVDDASHTHTAHPVPLLLRWQWSIVMWRGMRFVSQPKESDYSLTFTNHTPLRREMGRFIEIARSRKDP